MNEMPDNVKRFIDTYNRKLCIEDSSPHFNNIYHIISRDVNDNITEEKFGVNVLTDNGLSFIASNKYFQWWQDKAPRIKIGTGTSAINPADTDLEELVAEALCDNLDMTLDQTTPLVYDNVTGLTSSHSFTLRANFDYDISGVTEDKTITEIMIVWQSNEYSSQKLDVTHSRIYDENGNLSSFVKRLHEKTTVTVYTGVIMNIGSSVNTAWTNNNYMVISPYLYLNTLVTRLPLSRSGRCRLYDRFDHTTDTRNDFNLFNTRDTVAGSVYGDIVYGDPTLFEEGWVSKLLIKDGESTHRSVVAIVDHAKSIHLASPESIEITALSNFNDNTFSDALWSYCNSSAHTLQTHQSYRARLQLDQITPSHIQTYNHNTQLWEDEDFLGDSSFIYDHTFIYSVYYKTILNDNPIEVWIYPNSKAGEYDILSFITSAVHVWATDTYWDPSTWVEITTSNVESAYRNKRFYICSTKTELTPNYDYTCLQLDNVNTGYTIDVTGLVINARENYQMELIPNPKCNCLIGFNKIIYPDDSSNVVTYSIQNYDDFDCNGYVGSSYTGISTSSIGMFKITDDGDRLIMAHKSQTSYGAENNYSAGCYRIYTISNDKTVTPTFVDVQIPFTTQTHDTPTYHSFTDEGYVVAVHNEDQEIGIVNLYAAAGSETSVISGMWGIALNKTTLCVYRDSSDLSILKFNVYDMSTSAVTKTFTINGNYLMNGITGWKNNVYIRVYDQNNEQYAIVYYNISTDVTGVITDPVSTTSNVHPFNAYPSGIIDNGFRSCDECMVIPKNNPSSDQQNPKYDDSMNFYLIRNNDPTNFRDLETELNVNTLLTHGRFSTNTNGSFVGLEVCGTVYNDYIVSEYPYNSPITESRNAYLFDIGDFYDNNHFDEYIRSYNTTFSSTYGIQHTAYKEFDIIISGTDLIFNPIRRSRIHKIIGTTTTIQTINNPKRVQPTDTFTFKIQRS